jgi:uncharacterized integral membrane protein
MNAKLLFKTIFLIVVLLLLVLMGMNNPTSVTFKLPPVLPRHGVTQPAALMYFAFFAVGVLSGTVLTAGGGKGSGGAGKASKSAK